MPIWLLLMGLLVGACAAVNGVVGPGDMTISLQNGTTESVVLFVNGVRVKDLAPGVVVELPAGALVPLPWDAQVRLPTGRSLVSLQIHSGDVIRGVTGDAARVDLSCGRIDIWSGPPLAGPAPGPGIPGDCDP